ncbi:PD-(D/E)XK nuclease family protein [Gramella sp. Hel_I_59]|uniref:PDDEXK-like family protein n=1 Tax=Gramella sp. Hel_I_59 TaxID=1249978 RepID=UPI001C89EC29|nr:PD-(D/E)XK nuclease family protein [Gramella sp. Hel_I_59]
MSKAENLLYESGEIVKTHQDDIKEKGEDFNIFSILDMETKETKTHSAMLVALLDPTGNHYYDELFLKLFLEEIGYRDYQNENLKLVKVKAEYPLGTISQAYDSGGFIDILITFPSGKAIAIENKINAGDQKNQLYRYSLYKGNMCALYYLNLFGKSPTKESLHTLAKSDFKIISYKFQILKWLENCLNITKEGSIVENAIRQYYILIQKLTITMDRPLEDKLNKLIANNLNEAEFIRTHYQNVVNKIRERFRSELLKKLNDSLTQCIVQPSHPINHTYSKIWLTPSVPNQKAIKFGIESFSGKSKNNNGRIFIGIYDEQSNYEFKRDGDYRLSSCWPVVSDITTPDQNPLNLGSMQTLEKLNSDENYFENMLEASSGQIINFIRTYFEEN